jgi:hypothetical protein
MMETVADFARSLVVAAGYGQNSHEFCYARKNGVRRARRRRRMD